MTRKTLFTTYAVAFLVVSIPFTIIHLKANPNDSPITPVQHVVAAASFAGPWGVTVVHVVDFPNAGMRAFSWPLAIGLTLIGAALVALAFYLKRRIWQTLAIIAWFIFLVAWFFVGLTQIASGLL